MNLLARRTDRGASRAGHDGSVLTANVGRAMGCILCLVGTSYGWMSRGGSLASRGALASASSAVPLVGGPQTASSLGPGDATARDGG